MFEETCKASTSSCFEQNRDKNSNRKNVLLCFSASLLVKSVIQLEAGQKLQEESIKRG